MDDNAYYWCQNTIETYIKKGIAEKDFIDFLNKNENNLNKFILVTERVMKRNNITAEKDSLKKVLIDVVRDRYFVLKDMKIL